MQKENNTLTQQDTIIIRKSLKISFGSSQSDDSNEISFFKTDGSSQRSAFKKCQKPSINFSILN